MSSLEDMGTAAVMALFPDMSDQVQMLWHGNYWDGPLSGHVEVGGEQGFWVDCIDSEWDERPDDSDDSCSGNDGGEGCEDYPGNGKCCMTTCDRVYLIYKLDAEQKRIMRANHALFREHVGHHTDYDGQPSALKPQDSWKKFYDAPRETMPPPREDQIMGHTLRLFIEYKDRRSGDRDEPETTSDS
tara:strand:- start:507 stop:1064 length:558 start_codon:yes stop_codon:yes gene_type:complete